MITVTGHGDGKGREWLNVEYTTDAEEDQLRVLLLAAEVYAERNVKYKDNWKRMGWRGMLVRVRERAERMWDDFWDQSEPDVNERILYPPRDADDAIDLINFAAFFVRAVREGNRDGSWWGRP